MPSLTVVILTYNEQLNIGRCIECARLCTDKVVLIDSGSTDDTVRIAEKMGAKVYIRPLNGDFAAQRNYALEKVETAYVFYVDADEFVTADLADSVKAVVESDSVTKVYGVWRKNIAFGARVNYGVLASDCVYRIFPTSQVTWEGKVHERPVYKGAQMVLSGALLHETYSSWSQYWKKFDSYTGIWSQEAYERGKRTNQLSCFTHALGAFFKMFILKKGFLDGFVGWVLCCNHFSYTLAKYTKLLDIQKRGIIK